MSLGPLQLKAAISELVLQEWACLRFLAGWVRGGASHRKLWLWESRVLVSEPAAGLGQPHSLGRCAGCLQLSVRGSFYPRF